MTHPIRRRGFTMVDLIAVIILVGILNALFLPAVTTCCRDGRRTQCLYNAKQLSSGMLHYVNTGGRFPNAGTFGDDARGTYTRQIDGSELTLELSGTGRNAGRHDRGPLHSWLVDILPGIDHQVLYNEFNRDRVYFDDPELFGAVEGRAYATVKPSNLVIGETDLLILRCPNDDTIDPNRGNLSYAVNMGFVRWAGLPRLWNWNAVVGSSWRGEAEGGAPTAFTWGSGGYAHVRRTGVFFLGTRGGSAAWDMHHTIASIKDGTSETIMLSENVTGGAAEGKAPYSWTHNGHGVPMNWAAPHPNFVGFMASAEVCGGGRSINCAAASDLGGDGAGWQRANRKWSFEQINFGAKHNFDAGAHPYANSFHPGGVVVAFCDGSVRFVSEEIDGAVWAKLITPDGGSLPESLRQGTLRGEDLERIGEPR